MLSCVYSTSACPLLLAIYDYCLSAVLLLVTLFIVTCSAVYTYIVYHLFMLMYMYETVYYLCYKQWDLPRGVLLA